MGNTSKTTLQWPRLRWATRVRLYLNHLIDREFASYPAPRVTLADSSGVPTRASPLALTEQQTKVRDQIAKNFEETTKEARTIFLLHVSLLAYASLALANVQDRDFFVGGSTKLPFVDVQVSSSAFFAITPALIFVVVVYLHVYLGYVRRFRRRLMWYAPIDSNPQPYDVLFPWIGTLAEHSGPSGALVRSVYKALIWCAAPVVIFAYWARILFLRVDIIQFVMPSGPMLPPAILVGLQGVLALAVLGTWSAMRRALDARFLIDVPLRVRSLRWRIATCCAALVIVVTSWLWHPCLCIATKSYAPTCRANLFEARLSQTSPTGSGVVGAHLAYIQLPGAILIGAFLDNAKLEHANLERARMSNAWLNGARLLDTNLRGAVLMDTQLHGANLARANLEGAVLDGAELDGAHLYLAKMQGARLKNASFQGSELEQADLAGADLRNARFHGANLRHANLQGAQLHNAKFEGADLTDANLQGADLTDVDWSTREWAGLDPPLMRGWSKYAIDDANKRRGMQLDLARLELGDPPEYCGDIPGHGVVYDKTSICAGFRCNLLRKMVDADPTAVYPVIVHEACLGESDAR